MLNRILPFLLVLILWGGPSKAQNYLLESFDSETFPPTGWTQTQVSGTGLWEWERFTIGNFPSCLPHSGAGMAGYKSVSYPANTSAVIISPSFNLADANNHRLQFWMYRDNGITTKLDVIEYYINTTASLTNAHLLGTINRPITAEPTETTSGWYMYEFEIPESYNGTENYILLKATSKYGMNMFVDDVRVYVPVAANNPPTAFTIEGVTQTGMTVKWTDNSTNENGFRVYISTDGVNYSQYGSEILSTTQAETGTEYSQEITDLLPGTTYYFKISAYYELESGYLLGSQATLDAGQIVSTGTGNWNSVTTWSSGTIPTIADNVSIETGHTVTLNVNGYFNNITVNGSLGLQSYSLSGTNMDISETGSISISTGINANLAVTGNITNYGSLNFYPSESIYGRITFSGTNAQTLNSVGTTNLGNVVVDKGSSYNNIIEIITNGTFSIKSGSVNNFLFLTNGTIKISGTATVSNNVFSSIDYTIAETCGFWLNNPNFTVVGQNTNTTNNGLIRITQGTYNIGNTSGNSLGSGSGATYIIEGGTLNLASRFYTTNPINFNQSGGVINVNKVGNIESIASFGLVSSSNIITISGGNINLVNGSTASTPLDYNLQGSNITITGGTLNIGTETTISPYTFRIQGIIPKLVVDNTSNAKTALISANSKIRGNITVNEGSTLNYQSFNVELIGNSSQPGNIINNGLITNSSATGANRFFFVGGHGQQTVSGTGNFGNSTTPIAGIVFSNTSGVDIQSNIVTNWVNLLTGAVSGANKITLGNGGTSTPSVKRGGDVTKLAGFFSQAPVFNAGTSYSVLYSTALEPYNTGFELPSLITGTVELSTNVDVTLGASSWVQKLSFTSTNTGKLISASDKFLSVNGSLQTDIVLAPGNTGYVKGPLARVLPPSLGSGSTFFYPIGKGATNYFDLINPTTTSGGIVRIKVEVFDEPTGGTAGINLKEGSLGDRYWKAEIVSGQSFFISTALQVKQSDPALTLESGLARSASLTGSYDLVSTDQPIDNTIATDIITELGFFAIGTREVAQSYVSSTVNQPDTDIVFQGDENKLMVGIEIVVNGNDPALQLTGIDFSTNGTTNVADIANAKLYYTGTDADFEITTQVGETVIGPGETFSINPAQNLLEGTNYFWLVYDIAEDATDKNLVDAECVSITLNETDYTPSVTAPAGSRTIRSFLNGIYLVGTGGDYITISEAIDDLNLVGINGQVVFALTDELYSTSETFPITINDIINSSPDNYVAIKPAIGITPEIVGNSTDPLFIVNASFFGIDGSNSVDGTSRDLTLTNNGNGTNSGIILANSATNISFSNITAIGGLTSAGYGIILDGVSNAEIVNCQISKANIGIKSTGESDNILIDSNLLGSTILESKIHTNGIVAENTSSFIIRNNKVIGLTSATSATSSGIYITGTSTNGTIHNNEVRDIKNTQLPGYGSNGIWLNSSSTTSQISVYNNLISDIASYGYSGWDVGNNGYGIAITSGGGYGIYFNTIHLNTDQTNTNGRTAGLNISSTVSTTNSLDVRNNIIVNSQTIGTRYAVYSGASKTVFSDINHNNYYAPTTIGFITFIRTTLANWQTGTGKDANSLNVLPYFTSQSDLSLIDEMNCALDGFGTPILGIEKDFSGVDRDIANPDMGAIEFTSIPLVEPLALSEVTCVDGTIPPLEATTTGEAKWYSDAALTTLVHTGNIFDTGETEIGEYVYYITDNNGSCVSPSTLVSLSILEFFIPAISTLDNLTYCQNEVISVEMTIDVPGETRQWLLNGLEIIGATNETYTATEAGIYSVEVTNNGCTGTSNELTVTVNPIPEPTISTLNQLIYCEGEVINVEFTIDITGDSYQWLLNGNEIVDATSPTYTATEAGVYTFAVTTLGCTGISNGIEIVEKPLPVPTILTIDETNLCDGQEVSIEFTIDITGDTYQWLLNGLNIDGATQATFTATEAGIYSVEVTTNGCTGISSEISVAINPIPEPIISSLDNLVYCEGEGISTNFTIDITGDSYQWLLDGVNIDEATQATYTATDAGTYSVEITTNGCTGVSNEIEVVVNPLPAATIATNSNTSFCEGETVSVDFTINITGDSYQWLLNGASIDGATQATFTATEAGTFSVEVTTDGCFGISNEISVAINPIPEPIISSLDNLVYCEGEEISTNFTIGITGDSYQWLLDGLNIDGATQATFTATQAGIYSVEVTTNGCSGISNEISVSINPIPEPIISSLDNLVYCEGEEISTNFTIDITGDSYQWLLDGVNIDEATQATFTATEAGAYSVEVTQLACVGVSNEISVMVNPTPTPSISTDDSVEWFEGEAISVNFSVDIADADEYQWYLDDEPIENATLNIFEATTGGIYHVEVAVGECIGISNSITITVNPIPTYTITFTVTNTSSTAVENAEIVIESLDAIYTDVDGIATIDLPNGTYNFVVNADNFEAYASSFDVDGVALDIPVQLIGVGIDQNEILSVKAFPNPFSDEIRISNPELVNRVVISNIAGQKILEMKLDGQDIINTQALPVGVYIVRILGHNGKTAIYRMIKE